jgi:hypothetical protein
MSTSGLQDGQNEDQHAVWFSFHLALGIVLIYEPTYANAPG